MGSILFDFLTESLLFNPVHVDEQFRTVAEEDLAKELANYREFCLAHLLELQGEASSPSSILRVYAGEHRTSIATLKRSAFYVEQYVLPDPLFPLTRPSTAFSEAFKESLSIPAKGIDREALAEAVKYLRDLTAMVASNYVKFLPVSYLFEPPDELPVYYSENEFIDLLQPEVMAFFRERAMTRRLTKAKDGWLMEELDVCRAITIDFRDDDTPHVAIYHLFEQQLVRKDDITGIVTFRQYMPDTLPSRPYFDRWVRQSVHRTAAEYYYELTTEMLMTAQLGASYLSTSPFKHEVLQRFFPTKNGVTTRTAETFLNLELPFLDQIDTETLMQVRNNDGEVFQSFRHELERQFWDLQGESDPEKRRVRAEKVIFELGTVQHSALSMKVKDLRRGALAQATIITATLIGSIALGGLTVLAPIIGVANGISTAINYRKETRHNPAFFLWKVMH
jgi:hypothetical protein